MASRPRGIPGHLRPAPPRRTIPLGPTPRVRPRALTGDKRLGKNLASLVYADALGNTRDMVVYYERKSPNPGLELVKKIADFFGVTVGEMHNDTAKSRSKPGPPSKLEELTARLARLPANEQKVVIKMLEGALPKAS